MDFSRFDARGYPVIDVARGYAEWARTYEQVVCDAMDLRLLARVTCVDVSAARRAVDLACGTGRIGSWLRDRGVARIDGIDLTAAMLERARARGVYDDLRPGDLRRTPFEAAAYDLATASLVDEHLPSLAPMYAEAARLLAPGGWFLLVGYHPQFLMTVGMPTHFHRPDGEAVAIETHLHPISHHVRDALTHGLALREMHEGVVDEEFEAVKPKWQRYRGLPVSFVFAWRRARDGTPGEERSA